MSTDLSRVLSFWCMVRHFHSLCRNVEADTSHPFTARVLKDVYRPHAATGTQAYVRRPRSWAPLGRGGRACAQWDNVGRTPWLTLGASGFIHTRTAPKNETHSSHVDL